jgi:hypothetical protein
MPALDFFQLEKVHQGDSTTGWEADDLPEKRDIYCPRRTKIVQSQD